MTNKSRKEGVYLVEQKTKLQEMLEKKEKIKLGGGTKKIEKQRSSGKLTARERIDLLFDTGTFQEYNIFMKHRCHNFGMERVDTPAEGVVTGYGPGQRPRSLCLCPRFHRFGRSDGRDAGYEGQARSGACPGRRSPPDWPERLRQVAASRRAPPPHTEQFFSTM